MTTVDSVECDTLSLLPFEGVNAEIEIEDEMCPPCSQGWGNHLEGMTRLREEEGMLRTLAANLRELDSHIKFSEGMKRIDTLIENHVESWYKTSAYLLCIEKLAPIRPDLALEYVNKLECPSSQARAYLEIAKYQKGAAFDTTLQKAAALFNAYAADCFVPYYDELLARGGSAVDRFFETIYAKIQQYSRWSWRSEYDLLATAELEIKLQLPNAEESLKKAHEAMLQKGWLSWDTIYRLLDCEIQIESPLIFETLKSYQDQIKEGWWFDKMKLLAFEAKHPLLQAVFEKHLQEVLASVEDDFDLIDLVEALVVHQRSAAERVMERIETEEDRFYAELFLVRGDAHDPQFDRDAAVAVFKEKVERAQITNPREFLGLFKLTAEIFGPERCQFLLDEALLRMQPTVDALYAKELKEAGKTFAHYLGGAFGIDLPDPKLEGKHKTEALSRFSNLDFDRVATLLSAFSLYHFSETEELLQIMYEGLEEGAWFWGSNMLDMIRAEWTLLGY
ncbi:MAG: hypothetical protein AB7N99_01920 [Simkaniaceae bacterium]